MSRGGCQCSVAICKNRSTKNKTLDSPLSYYSFPRDPTVRELWIKSCKRDGHWNPSTSRICSEHFSPDQFEDDMEARIMGLKRAKKLKPGAVPTLKLSLTESLTENKLMRPRRRKLKTLVEEDFIQQTPKKRGKHSEKILETLTVEPDVEIIEIKHRPQESPDECSDLENTSEKVPHCLECPFVEENNCLKAEVASLKLKLKESLKKLHASKKKNSALETALIRCLTLKATPP